MTVAIQHYSEVVFTRLQRLAIRTLILVAIGFGHSHAAVRFERVPQNGAQPQVVIDAEARVHLIYFRGDGMGGDLFYATKSRGAGPFSPVLPVNQKAGSVIVAGTMRGPHMTLGRDGRVHVVWMGGNGADKVQIDGEAVTPLLYARLGKDQKSFEPERNILTHIAGLDGGQTVAADEQGNVYVIWHGAPPRVEGEEARGLYVAHSRDDGKSFAREWKAEVPRRGACACCGVRARTDSKGALHVLFRSAEAGMNRNELWLKSEDAGKSFRVLKEDPWKTGTCPASSAFLHFGEGHSIGAWETDNRVTGAILSKKGTILLQTPGTAKQKHPVLAVNARGEVLLTWVEDASWGGEGTLVAQMFSSDGVPVGEAIRQTKLPAWSFGAPYAEANGDFVVLF